MYYFVDSPVVITNVPEEVDCVLAASADNRFVAVSVRNQIYFHCQKTFLLLGQYRCKPQTIESFGEISELFWNERGDKLLIQTLRGYLMLLCLNVIEQEITDASLTSDSPFIQPYHLEVLSFRVLKRVGLISCCATTVDKIIAADCEGNIFSLTWSGDVIAGESIQLHHLTVQSTFDSATVSSYVDPTVFSRALYWAPTFGGIVCLLTDDRILLLLLSSLQIDPLTVKAVWVAELHKRAIVSVNNRFRLFTVGDKIGNITAFRFDDSVTSPLESQNFRLPDLVLHAMERPSGSVKVMAWSPDGYCLAVSWQTRGMALWSVFGALLYTTLMDQTEVTRFFSPLKFCWTYRGFHLWAVVNFIDDPDRCARRTNLAEFRERLLQNCNSLPSTQLQITANLAKIKANLQLLKSETNMSLPADVNGSEPTLLQDGHESTFLIVMRLAKSALLLNPTTDNHRHTLVCRPDSVLLCVRRFLNSCRNLIALPLPIFYARLNAPIKLAALNASGSHLAVSGYRGFAICSLATLSWRLFGNVNQEQSFEVHAGLAWWKNYVCFSAFNHDTGRCELRCYPTNEKLDDRFASVCTLEIVVRPLLLDVIGNRLFLFSTDGYFRSFQLDKMSAQKHAVSFLPQMSVNLSTYLPHASCLNRICLFYHQPPSAVSNLSPPNNRSRTQLDHTETDRSFPDASLLVLYAGNLLFFPYHALSMLVADEAATSSFADFFPSFSKREINPTKYRDSFTPTLIASSVEFLWTYGSAMAPAGEFTRTTSLSDFSSDDGLSADDTDVEDKGLNEEVNSYSNVRFRESPLRRQQISIPLLDCSVWIHCGGQGLKIWFPVSVSEIGRASSVLDFTKPVSPLPAATTNCGFFGVFMKTTRRVMLSIRLESLVYPLTILLDKAVIITAKSSYLRTDRSFCDTLTDQCFQMPWSSIQIKTNLFLPHLLKDLLSKNLSTIADDLATAYQQLPYFQHILELLLHEVLEEEATSKFPIPDPLLPQVTAFIEHFPHFLDVIIQCTRKTEVTWWRYLFCALGRRPKDIFDQALSMDQLDTAASCLVVLQNSESLVTSKQCALVLMTRAIEQCQWKLLTDLMRFLKATSMPARSPFTGLGAPTSFPGTVFGDSDPFNEVDLLIERTKCRLLREAQWQRLEELFANLPNSSLSTQAIAGIDPAFPIWILRNREFIPQVEDWPACFLDLHSSFNWIIRVKKQQSPSRSLSLDSSNVRGDCLRFRTLSNSTATSTDAKSNQAQRSAVTSGSSFSRRNGVQAARSCRQLYFLLAHLAWVARDLLASRRASSHENFAAADAVCCWAVIVAVLLLDRKALFTIFSLLPTSKEPELIAWLLAAPSGFGQQGPVVTSSSLLFRILSGLDSLAIWAVQAAPTYSNFFLDLRTDIISFVKTRTDQLSPSLTARLECPADPTQPININVPHTCLSKSGCSDTVSRAFSPPKKLQMPNGLLHLPLHDAFSTKILPFTVPICGQNRSSEDFETSVEPHLVHPDGDEYSTHDRSSCTVA